MTKRISELTISKPLSGSEQFEINQTQNSTLNSYSVSAGAIRTFVESTSVVIAFKNKIINGNFDIWQRATSQTSSGYGSDDRWINANSGSTTTHSRQSFTVGQADVPNNPKYFSRTVVTTGSGASDYVQKTQRIESVYTLAGKATTLSFWAKADSSKDIAVSFSQIFGTGGSPSAAVTGIGSATISLTSSWQKFTVTVDIPSISGKTLGSNNDDYFSVSFWFDAGSDFDSITNSLGNQSGTFDIAQVQLEKGSVATPFEQRPIGVELALCQRYFQKTYDLDVIPGTVTSIGRRVTYVSNCADSGHTVIASWDLSVEMRDNPSVTFYSPVTGTSSKLGMSSGDVDIVGSFIGRNNIQVWGNNGATSTTRQCLFHAIADAEL